MKICFWLLTFGLSATCVQANPLVAPVPVPNSPYLPRIYRYVDGLLADSTQATNLHHHQNLLRLLYTLSELSGKPKYRDAADAALRQWLESIPSPDTKISRPWMLWNRCFEIAPEASVKYALAVINTQNTSHPGFYLRTGGAAYAHTTNKLILNAIEVFLKEAAPSLSLAIDSDGTARLLPEPLASGLRAFAERADMTVPFNPAPQTAMMLVSRYENTGKIAYRDALHSAANAELNVSPTEDIVPMTLGHRISLQTAAWRSNARRVHLEKARALADFALTNFFNGPPELAPGADTLALSLVELHLHILYITAVRYPPNTLDR